MTGHTMNSGRMVQLIVRRHNLESAPNWHVTPMISESTQLEQLKEKVKAYFFEYSRML